MNPQPQGGDTQCPQPTTAPCSSESEPSASSSGAAQSGPSPDGAAPVTDEQLREAFDKDIQQWFTDCLTPDRGYPFPMDNVKALLRSALAAETDALEALKKEKDGIYCEWDKLRAENAKLKAEIDELRATALDLMKAAQDDKDRTIAELDKACIERDRALADASALRAALMRAGFHAPINCTRNLDDCFFGKCHQCEPALSEHPGDRLRDAVELAGKALYECRLMVENEIRCRELAGVSANAWPDLLTGCVSGGGILESLAALAPFRREQGQPENTL